MRTYVKITQRTVHNYGSVTDIEGNSYKTIQIGDQVWMAENLAVTKYNDGTEIPLVTINSTWSGLSSPAYCWYDNIKATYKPKYGALYNWYVVETGKLCPTGWHVPVGDEWKELEMHLGMSSSEADDTRYRGSGIGTKLKSTSGWNNNGNGTNESGFNALPGGYRNYYYGSLNYEGDDGAWWTSTPFGISKA